MGATTERAVPAGHSLLLWAAREHEPGPLALICAEAAGDVLVGPDEQVVAWRGCLAGLPAVLPLELLELGVPTVVLDRTGCTEQWPTDWTELTTVIAVSDAIQVRTTAPDDGHRPRRVLDADAMPVLRRRSIFGLGASGEPDPQLPDRTGTPQQRLRAVALRLAGDREMPSPPEDGWRSGALELTSDGCVACGVCVRTCPEDALALETSDQRAGLGFDPSLCTGCGSCLPVCPADALTSPRRLGPPALFAEPKLLELFEVRRCVRCKAAFRGVGEYCPVCEFRVANPFGSVMPPGSTQGV